jgi:HK97 family phage prohead protease
MNVQRIEGPAWTRAAEVTAVKGGRMIEIVVIPYDTPAAVSFDGRPVEERIARGAFDGVETRPARIAANRDHDPQRLVGRARALYPRRQQGLVADIRISQIPIGDETLELCRDGVLAASAGFWPDVNGVQWDDPPDCTSYTITSAWLDHVAFTPNPAYSGTEVLSIRSMGGTAALEPAAELVLVTATPLLDEWRASLAAEQTAARAASLGIA